MSGNPPNPPAYDAIDFELTDFSEARDALNDLPAGVKEMALVREGGWEGRRRKPTATDRALTGQAIDWLLALPQTLRPKELCERFPRIINRIAAQWADLPQAVALMDELLGDTRDGRAGFPAPVLEELRLLRQLLPPASPAT